MRNLLPEYCFLEIVDYGPSSSPLIPHEKHSMCVRLEDSAPNLGTSGDWQLSPQLPGPVLLLLEMASLLALEIAPNAAWTVTQPPTFPYGADQSAVKTLTTYTVRSQSSALTQEGNGIEQKIHPASGQLPNLLLLNGCVFYWQSMIFPNVSINTTQAVLSQTFHWILLPFL